MAGHGTVREGGRGEVRKYRQQLVGGKWKSVPDRGRLTKNQRFKLGQEVWPEGEAKPRMIYRFGTPKEPLNWR